MKLKPNMLDLWYAALASPYGIEIGCSPSIDSVQQALYRARAEAHDEDLKALAICHSPFDPNLLWIVRREPSNDAP